ncbi:ABC-F family ATP-binding cassette domain-containing protein [Candidatus Uhrbacteria bacterium]|nr:MAG: ABC-F family ATP-binding cassette domain-containing protein [Candidatus Uhrbacteria bacterium]
MDHGNVILRFGNVSFAYDEDHPILDEVNFSVRENAKITLMGQNGAGKSSIFKLLTGVYKPQEGEVHIQKGAKVAIGLQVMAREHMEKTVQDYFAQAFEERPYNLDKLIKDVLETVNLETPLDKKIRDFSGGQQARLLLAYALIQEPDILLLDEPTNNLDKEGIEHLTGFLMMYPKTVLVISHDADFLNAFTEGVLHLDVYTHKVEQYVGNYFNVVEEIAARVERDRMQNARMLKEIQDRKDKINFFANKGGKMRKLASKLRDQVEDAEENMVDVKRDDCTIRDFKIPAQEYNEPVITFKSIQIIRKGHAERVEVDLSLRKKRRLLISGPNGIGKTTLLRAIAEGTDEGIKIGEGVKVGYYRQDFSGLDFDQTAYQSLESVMEMPDNEKLRAVAAEFLLTSDLLKNKVGSLSEGQKGLLCFARFVLQEPGLLILDEPTNHINFRHLPVIAEAVENYQGTLIMVSHAPDFLAKINFNETLDLAKFI